MKQSYIQNINDLRRTKERKGAITILNARFNAINTKNAIRNLVRLDGEVLHVEAMVMMKSITEQVVQHSS